MLEYWAPVSEFAPRSCEEQIRIQALNLLRLLACFESSTSCLFSEICTCCFLSAVIQTLHLIVFVLIFDRGLIYTILHAGFIPPKRGNICSLKNAKQHAGNKAIALSFPIWLVVLCLKLTKFLGGRAAPYSPTKVGPLVDTSVTCFTTVISTISIIISRRSNITKSENFVEM